MSTCGIRTAPVVRSPGGHAMDVEDGGRDARWQHCGQDGHGTTSQQVWFSAKLAAFEGAGK
jgi:hypothetical protein